MISDSPYAYLEPDYKALVKDVCDKNPNQVAAYKMDKIGVLGFFIGLIMKETRGSVNPHLVKDALIKELNSHLFLLRLLL